MAKQAAAFLKQYDIILFDMDGVITSEQRYWDASALALYQLFHNHAIDATYAMEHVKNIRKEIFCSDKTILLLKERGVNSNWDLTYVMYATAEILHTTTDYKAIYDYLQQSGLNALELYAALGKTGNTRFDEKYNHAVSLFQEWYFGEAAFRKHYGKQPSIPGKPGLCEQELPIFPIPETRDILKTLYTAGKVLGTGTGRTRYEAVTPLKHWDLLQYFDENRIVTYDDIQQAEWECPSAVLTKPHPYMFLKGMLGLDYSNTSIVVGNYEKDMLPKTLVIGDAGADLFSAQAAGLDFAAVLTGVSGQKARGYFEQNHATYILNSIQDLIEDV